MTRKTIKYGIVGFSRNQFDKMEAHRILSEIFENIYRKHQGKNVEIVSGYTNSGIPKMAYELAEKYNFVKVGFSARQALGVRSGLYPVDKKVLVGERFGDESVEFVRYIDALVRVGGGKQSRNEVVLFQQENPDKQFESYLKEYEIEWYGDQPKSEQKIEGLMLIDNFISKPYHEELIRHIDQSDWSDELKRRVQHYGYKYDYRTRGINESMRVSAIPKWVDPVVEKIVNLKLMDTKPDQMIINEYEPGQGISNHIDCEPCFEDTIISVSLSSTTVMNFTNVETKEVCPIVLNPRSAMVMKGEARYKWMHGIPGRKSDTVNGEKIQRERRVSLTFRKVKLGK